MTCPPYCAGAPGSGAGPHGGPPDARGGRVTPGGRVPGGHTTCPEAQAPAPRAARRTPWPADHARRAGRVSNNPGLTGDAARQRGCGRVVAWLPEVRLTGGPLCGLRGQAAAAILPRWRDGLRVPALWAVLWHRFRAMTSSRMSACGPPPGGRRLLDARDSGAVHTPPGVAQSAAGGTDQHDRPAGSPALQGPARGSPHRHDAQVGSSGSRLRAPSRRAGEPASDHGAD
jgi:hypothetical protein